MRIYYTDEVNTCDCCGKTPLKSTVAFECQETGETLHFGSVCAGAVGGLRLTGNPHKALARLGRHAAATGLSFEDIAEAMHERVDAREAA